MTIELPPTELFLAFQWSKKQFCTGAVESPHLAAELLLAHSLQLSVQDIRKACILRTPLLLSEEQQKLLWVSVMEHLQAKPIAQILGEWDFYGRPFKITPYTLIPRPETELIVDSIKALLATSTSVSFSPQQPLQLVDFGTGTGCLAITLFLELQHFYPHVFAVEQCPLALKTAQENAQLLHTDITFIQADFTTPLFQPKSLDIIVSNPPYVSSCEYVDLDISVRNFEPISALVPQTSLLAKKDMLRHTVNQAVFQQTGMETIEKLVPLSALFLKPDGWFFMEFGAFQGAAVSALFSAETWQNVHIHKDLAGHDRFVVAQRNTV